MDELLFGNKLEKEALENILALNQIKKCDNEIDEYTKEIDDLKGEIKQILSESNIEEDYVSKIKKYKDILNKLDGDNGRIGEIDSKIKENNERIDEFQTKINDVEDKLESLKQEIFETDEPSKVIDCQNEIENNNVKLNELNEILNKLISDNTPLLIEKEYLSTKNAEIDFNVPNYNKEDIKKELLNVEKEFKEIVEKLDLPTRENIEFCQKKINNRENEIDKYNSRKNEVIGKYPNAIKINIQEAYEDIENLLEELDIKKSTIETSEKNIFDETEKDAYEEPVLTEKSEIEPETVIEPEPVIEPKEEIKEGLASLKEEEQAIESNEKFVEENKEVFNEKITDEIAEESKSEEEMTKNEEIGSVTYVLSEGESFENIAEKVYPSKNNWEAIYYFNKDIIDNFLVANGISNDLETVKQLSNDTSLFTGIQLEIPTDYNYKK